MRKILLLVLAVFAIPALAKSVSTPAELGPYDFRSYIDSRFGSITAVSDRGDSDTAIEIIDPFIGGVQFTGMLQADNRMTVAGPTTWVNVLLGYEGGDVAIDATFIDVISEVTYDLAAFGPGSEAQVRITGGGFGASRGGFSGLVFSATASSSGNIYLYETDENGNLGAFVNLWSIMSFGIYNSDPERFTRINSVFTIDTNKLYKVVVRSKSHIQLSNPTPFELAAHVTVDPLFSSETAGVEVHVSNYAYSESLVSASPERVTLRSDGSPTEAVISGGARLANASTFTDEFHVGETIKIEATLQPEIADIAKTANVFAVVTAGDGFSQLTPNGLSPFDGTVEALIPLEEVALRASTELDILAPFGGQVTLTEAELGMLKFFIGYSTDDGVIRYNDEPITVNVVAQ